MCVERVCALYLRTDETHTVINNNRQRTYLDLGGQVEEGEKQHKEGREVVHALMGDGLERRLVR